MEALVEGATEQTAPEKSAASLLPVAPAEIQPYWGVLEPLMIKVVEGMGDRQTMASLLQQIMQGEIQLWAVVVDREIKAVAGTEIGEAPSGLVTCCVRFCVGAGARNWIGVLQETVEDYARANGCHRVETWARKGWAKHLPEYKLTHVLLERDL